MSFVLLRAGSMCGEKGPPASACTARPPSHLGRLYRAQMMKRGFWFHFGRLAAKQIHSACKMIRTLQATVLPPCSCPWPFSTGQGTVGPGSGQPSWARAHWAEAACLCECGSSRKRAGHRPPGGGGPRGLAAHRGAQLPGAESWMVWSRGEGTLR